MVRTDMTQFPEALTRHKPVPRRHPRRALHAGRAAARAPRRDRRRVGSTPLAGRFLHATDDPDAACVAAVAAADPRARTLRLAPGVGDEDPLAR